MERKAAVAGHFYPSRKEALESLTKKLLRNAKKTSLAGKIKGIIVPHAALVCSGLTAAHAYAVMPKSAKRIVLLGVSHHAGFDGVVYSPANYWETSLGKVKVNKPKFGQPNEEAHAHEHCLEVQLPFLQTPFRELEIMPLLTCFADPKKIAEELEKEDGFFVFSTDLSHFLPYDEAVEKDKQTISNVVNLNFVGIREDDACGRIPLLTAMHLAKNKNWSIRLLHYSNSGDTCGGKDSVVGYASFALAV